MYGGGYGSLGNFQERQFSHTRTRNVGTMLLCASFLFLNGRFESSSSRADPRKTSDKCKFMDKKIFPLVFAKDSASFRRKLVSSPKGLRCKQGFVLRRKWHQMAFEVFPQFRKYPQIAFEVSARFWKCPQMAFEVLPQVWKCPQITFEPFARFWKCLQMSFEVPTNLV